MDTTLQGVDLYATLDISHEASENEIRRAYRRKSMQLHPDHGGSDAEFATLSLAYKILMDPQERAYYDRTGQIREETRIDKDAMQLLRTLFMQAVNQLGDRIFFADMIANIKKVLDQNSRKGNDEILKERKEIKHLEKVKSKLKRKSGPPFLEDVLDDAIRGHHAQIATCEEAIEISKKATEMICEYEFLFELGPDLAWKTFGYNPTTITRPDFLYQPTTSQQDGEVFESV